MNAQDKELITAVATSVMGWPALDKPIEHGDTGDVVFFWDERNKPIRAAPYATTQPYREHGGSDYGHNWYKWNPLIDPAAFMDVVNKLTKDGGNVVTLTMTGDETLCTICHPYPDMPLVTTETSATPGRAVCKAAVQFLKDAGDYTPEKLDAGFCQHGDDPDTCAWCKAKPQDEALGRMRLLAQGISQAYRWVTTDKGGNVYAWTSRPQIEPPQWTWYAAWDVKAIYLGDIPNVPSVVSYRDLIIEINTGE